MLDRRSLLVASIACVLTVWIADNSHANLVTWGTAQNITGDGDVSTNGTLVGAVNFGTVSGQGQAVDTTVNGVAFAGVGADSGAVTSGVFTLTGIVGSTFTGTSGAPYINLSSDYQAMLSGGVGATPGSLQLTMNGLTIGQSYEFQWWTNRSNNLQIFTTATAGNSVTLSTNTGVPGSGVGQFAIGTFIADATSQTISFQGTGAGNTISILNGVQLRVTSVPESSSLLFMASIALCTALGRTAIAIRNSRRLS